MCYHIMNVLAIPVILRYWKATYALEPIVYTTVYVRLLIINVLLVSALTNKMCAKVLPYSEYVNPLCIATVYCLLLISNVLLLSVLTNQMC